MSGESGKGLSGFFKTLVSWLVVPSPCGANLAFGFKVSKIYFAMKYEGPSINET